MPGDDHALHLVRALADLEDLLVAIEPRDRELVHEAVPAVDLERGVDDPVREDAGVELRLRGGERGQGFPQFLEILDGGRISVAAMGVGLAQGAYDLALAYAKERHQFGKPIASFQAIQFRLADMITEIEAGRAMVYRAAWLKDHGRPFALEAAMAKLYTGELSHRVANYAVQIHGGYGYMEESAISRFYRDQKILEIGEGTNEVQRMVIARHLGL